MNDYCKMNKTEWSKYHAANISGHTQTIELRFFRCTMILKNIIKYLIFANDIVTKDLSYINKKYFS